MTILESRDLGERDGFQIRARIEPDYDTRPTDFDCYDEEQTRAWRDDRWHFVVVVVTASREGVELGSAVLGAVEAGYLPLPDKPHNYVDPFGIVGDYDMPAEAIAEAQEAIERISTCGGVYLSRDQLEAWAGRSLTDDELDRLDDAIPHSSIPDAVATIVAHMHD